MILPDGNNAQPTLRAVDTPSPLLSEKDGSPVELVNPHGQGSVLLICEHASHRMPERLGALGLPPEARRSHVAWDPGAAEVATAMAKHLDAPLFLQRFSRLVYDCNRPPDAPSAIPAKSEIYDIPGNEGLSATERAARVEALYTPFHGAIDHHLDTALAAGRTPAIVTIHSFTPIFHDQPRAVQLGLLHDRDDRLARVMLDLGGTTDDLDIRLNEPYAIHDGVMHTIQRHALSRGLLNVMIEIRNDLILDRTGQNRMATNLVKTVNQALHQLSQAQNMLRRRASG